MGRTQPREQHCVYSFLFHRHTSLVFSILFAFYHSFVSFMLHWIITYEFECMQYCMYICVCLKQHKKENFHMPCAECDFKAYFLHYIQNALMRSSFDSLISSLFLFIITSRLMYLNYDFINFCTFYRTKKRVGREYFYANGWCFNIYSLDPAVINTIDDCFHKSKL